MYAIVKISLDDKNEISGTEIVGYDHVLTVARKSLANKAINFVKDECGKANDCKIIDIATLGQVQNPMIDTMLIYRVACDPQCLHIYQRKTKIVPGIVYGQSTVSEFRRIKIFSIAHESVEPIRHCDDSPVDMVSAGQNNIKIPGVTANLITQLKKSPRFIACGNDAPKTDSGIVAITSIAS